MSLGSGKSAQSITESRIQIIREFLQEFPLESDSFSPGFSRVNVSEVISVILKTLRCEKECKVPILENLEKDVMINGDRILLELVFQNLLDNSSKFTKRGFIKVDVITNEKNDVFVKILDTGMGIPLEVFPNLFEKCPSRDTIDSKQSSGLGLYLCKQIIESHGGKIYANDNEYDGATFVVKFPIKMQKVNNLV